MIAERIKNYVDEKGIKQIAIANATGMSKVAVSETLNGNRTLTAEEMVRICRFLEVPCERFFDSPDCDSDMTDSTSELKSRPSG